MAFDALTRQETASLLTRAVVPEHSVAFMQAMSGGKAFVLDGYLFLTAEDWLMGVGYPLAPAGTPVFDRDGLTEEDNRGFTDALERALAATEAKACWAVGPGLPARLEPYIHNRDVFYILPSDSPVPPGLLGPVSKAAKRLQLTEERIFTPAHRRLWSEFLGRVAMPSNVRELYARTEAVLAASRADERQPGEEGGPVLDLRLLSAWDDGDLAAALLLDYSPAHFCAYIIGAHSRVAYSPHATDCLFAAMLEQCRSEGKKFIHLGLGVNPGITRFKKKWGGLASLPYVMAAWTEEGVSGRHQGAAVSSEQSSDIGQAMRSLLAAPAGLSKQQIFDTFPKQRPFAMIYEVRKGESVSYLCGTAHFFCYSFEMSFRKIFDPLHTVIFEGPLDDGFLSAVEKTGRSPEPGTRTLAEGLEEPDIRRLERIVYGPEGVIPRILGMQHKRIVDVRHLLAHTRPWFAFFTLWVAFLERQGWSQSVDLEAWGTARDMGKIVIGMENLKEQIASLEAVPYTRITDFLRRCGLWPGYMKRNIRAYLSGDLSRMMGSSIEFPSRTEMVIEYRDTRFFERMLPFMETGNCAVFVGTAHLVGLKPMLEKAGFSVRPYHTSAWLKLRSRLRPNQPGQPNQEERS